jgi:hypothetical protein
VFAYLNLLLQAALLALSLVSLAEGANSAPPWLAIAAAVGGLVLLTAHSLGVVRLRGINMFIATGEIFPPE